MGRLRQVARGCVIGACLLGGVLGVTAATAWGMDAGTAGTVSYPTGLVISQVFSQSASRFGQFEAPRAAISLAPLPVSQWAPDSSSS